jgi:ADP-ribose pyrophosphatase YjhB (NUDIX family)
MRFHYCPKCGSRLEAVSRNEENKPRCTGCGFIFYQNPIAGAAAIVILDRKILLGRRKGSYQGKWCIPCGYVEWDEDIYAAVKREFGEETGLSISVDRVYTVLSNFHNPQQHTVGVWFLAHVQSGELCAGDDLEDVAFFHFHNLPELAFPTDGDVIKMLKTDNLID